MIEFLLGCFVYLLIGFIILSIFLKIIMKLEPDENWSDFPIIFFMFSVVVWPLSVPATIVFMIVYLLTDKGYWARYISWLQGKKD